jgi:hypothetical protein
MKKQVKRVASAQQNLQSQTLSAQGKKRLRGGDDNIPAGEVYPWIDRP